MKKKMEKSEWLMPTAQEGEAEGEENDENLFRSICVLLQPPLSVAKMSNQARLAVLQSYNLLKW